MSFDILGNLMVSTDPSKSFIQLLGAVFEQLRIANAYLAQLVRSQRECIPVCPAPAAPKSETRKAAPKPAVPTPSFTPFPPGFVPGPVKNFPGICTAEEAQQGQCNIVVEKR